MPEIMTLPEAAEYLRIGKRTCYQMAQSGQIPVRKVGNQWRFNKTNLDNWSRENSEPSRRFGVLFRVTATKKNGKSVESITEHVVGNAANVTESIKSRMVSDGYAVKAIDSMGPCEVVGCL